jgi:Fur family ferric uptake transcriptional regulator
VKTEKDYQFQRSQRMLRALAEAGYSDTRARRAVVRAFAEMASRATPAELLALGKRFHAGLGQVTVYRTLEILHSLGLVRRISHEDGSSSYAATDRPHGHHIVCTRCHSAVEFEGCRIQPLLEKAVRQTGYSVSGHWLELTGLCPDCQPAGAGA